MKTKDFSYYLSHFLKEYLEVERNMSSNTIRSYKKTFQLLLSYLVNQKSINLIDINFETITKEKILDFLNYIEENGNSIRTRNQRLAAIKSFYQFCSIEEIQHIDNIKKVLSIRSKKFVKKVQTYLEEKEIKTLFDSVDTTTKKGRRNLLVLVLLYDTGARADEITRLKLENIRLEESLVILTGKGNKQRVVSIMENTKKLLIQYLKENKIEKNYIFPNKNQSCMNERFIRDVINKYAKCIDKNITPHTFRRTRATHLLEKGVNILYIKEFLGHENVSTTQEYTKVIEKSKFESIAKATPQMKNDELLDWNDDQDLLSQLLKL